MQDVNAKRSFNAAKRSLMLNIHPKYQTYFDNYQVVQSQANEVMEYCIEDTAKTGTIFREIFLHDFWIQISSLHLPHSLCLHSEKREDIIQMHFSLSIQNSAHNHDFYVDITAGTCNLLFIPKHLPDYNDPDPDTDLISFQVNFLSDYFNKNFADFLTPYSDFMSRIQKGEAALLSHTGIAMPPRMKQIVADIMQCQLIAPLKKVYLTAKVHELLVWQIEQFGDQQEEKCKFSQTDRTKLELVKDILISRRNTLSLHDLSLECGLNLDKLKKGFKAMYGTTVFGYLTDIKMEEARQRLLSMDTTVSEVAEKAGYKNPQHFTAAFKRKYGVLPRDMKH